MKIEISSSAIGNDGAIPEKYTCDGESINPPLVFANIPREAKSLALIMEDPDVPRTIRMDGIWDHWIVWNIPPDTAIIEDGVPPSGIFGMNTNGEIGYAPPCPPDGTHRYIFKLFALKQMLALPEGANKQELLASMEGKILDQAELIGTYYRQ